MESTLTLDPLFTQAIVSLLLPIVVGLVTKLSASSGVKALTLLLTNAVSALVVQATQADGSAIIEKQAFILWVFGVIISVATHYGVYKPTGVSERVQTVTANVGIGKPVDESGHS